MKEMEERSRGKRGVTGRGLLKSKRGIDKGRTPRNT